MLAPARGQQFGFTTAPRELGVLKPLETKGLRDKHVSVQPCHCCKYLYITVVQSDRQGTSRL